jgi:hypothetical protein
MTKEEEKNETIEENDEQEEKEPEVEVEEDEKEKDVFDVLNVTMDSLADKYGVEYLIGILVRYIYSYLNQKYETKE